MAMDNRTVVFVLPGIAGGGAERMVLNLYKALELYKGYECHIISLSRNVSHSVDAGLRVHYLDEAMRIGKRGLKRFTYRKVLAKLVDDHIDQAIGRNCIVLSNMMFCDKIMSLSRQRVFHVIHSSYGQALLGGKPCYRQFFIKRNINHVYRNHPMIFVSQGALDGFCAHFRSGVAKSVIYNPVNEDEVRALAEREPAGLEGDYIVHVGRFNRQKRHDRLLRAFAQVQSNVKLLLLGDGRLEANVRSLAGRLGLTERVLFMGFRQNPYPLIKGAKALVLTSDVEGLPTVVLEAICLGTAVVATDCPGGIREIIDSNSPSLVPPDDIAASASSLAAAIDDALAHPEKYTCPLDEKFTSRFAADDYDRLFG
jgi:glycosyltransferase involved in cell wall biosynthesis